MLLSLACDVFERRWTLKVKNDNLVHDHMSTILEELSEIVMRGCQRICLGALCPSVSAAPNAKSE